MTDDPNRSAHTGRDGFELPGAGEQRGQHPAEHRSDQEQGAVVELEYVFRPVGVFRDHVGAEYRRRGATGDLRQRGGDAERVV